MLIGDMVDVFRKGKMVANPALWKNVGAATGAIAGLASSALAVAAAFGYRVDLSDDAVQALAAGVAGALYLFTSGLHITTSDKVGLPAQSADSGSVSDGSNAIGADPAAVREFVRRASATDADQV